MESRKIRKSNQQRLKRLPVQSQQFKGAQEQNFSRKPTRNLPNYQSQPPQQLRRIRSTVGLPKVEHDQYIARMFLRTGAVRPNYTSLPVSRNSSSMQDRLPQNKNEFLRRQSSQICQSMGDPQLNSDSSLTFNGHPQPSYLKPSTSQVSSRSQLITPRQRWVKMRANLMRRSNPVFASTSTTNETPDKKLELSSNPSAPQIHEPPMFMTISHGETGEFCLKENEKVAQAPSIDEFSLKDQPEFGLHENFRDLNVEYTQKRTNMWNKLNNWLKRRKREMIKLQNFVQQVQEGHRLTKDEIDALEYPLRKAYLRTAKQSDEDLDAEIDTVKKNCAIELDSSQKLQEELRSYVEQKEEDWVPAQEEKVFEAPEPINVAEVEEKILQLLQMYQNYNEKKFRESVEKKLYNLEANTGFQASKIIDWQKQLALIQKSEKKTKVFEF